MEQTNERWRPVRGYEGTFLVSDLGRVMNNLEWVTSEENIDRAKKMGLLGKTKG